MEEILIFRNYDPLLHYRNPTQVNVARAIQSAVANMQGIKTLPTDEMSQRSRKLVVDEELHEVCKIT